MKLGFQLPKNVTCSVEITQVISLGEISCNKDGGARQSISKEHPRGTKTLFCGREYLEYFSSLRGTNSETTHISSRIFVCSISLKRYHNTCSESSRCKPFEANILRSIKVTAWPKRYDEYPWVIRTSADINRVGPSYVFSEHTVAYVQSLSSGGGYGYPTKIRRKLKKKIVRQVLFLRSHLSSDVFL